MNNGETYSPVSKLTTFRLLISLAALYNWRINHLDVIIAFFNPDVDDDTLFLELSEGCADETRTIVVQLRKHFMISKPYTFGTSI
jgi:hypothetical protein